LTTKKAIDSQKIDRLVFKTQEREGGGVGRKLDMKGEAGMVVCAQAQSDRPSHVFCPQASDIYVY
jgi:hypothetical protein